MPLKEEIAALAVSTSWTFKEDFCLASLFEKVPKCVLDETAFSRPQEIKIIEIAKIESFQGICTSQPLLSFLAFICMTEYLVISLVVRKPVFGVSDQVRHKPGCTATEDG